ncbi:MAG: MBL fold metallo-hydrolase [Balneolaceae bacterium]
MKIKTFEVGPFLENTYVLSKDNSGIIIDPGFSNESEFQILMAYLKETEVELRAVILTHAHVDHVLGLQRLLKDFDIPVYLNSEDHFLWGNFGNQATMFGLRQVGFSFTPEELPNSGIFRLESFVFECLYTPGHSPDHTSLYFESEGFLIVGDALFRESIGRTDLYKGDFELLKKSILEKLYVLPDATKVYPGHGLPTTIGYEKSNNPFVST